MDVSTQLDVLNNGIFSDGKLPLFKKKLKEVNIIIIKATSATHPEHDHHYIYEYDSSSCRLLHLS